MIELLMATMTSQHVLGFLRGSQVYRFQWVKWKETPVMLLDIKLACFATKFKVIDQNGHTEWVHNKELDFNA